MEGWSKISSSITSLNIGQSASKIAKNFNSNVQAAKERLGQVSAEELTDLPPGHYSPPRSLNGVLISLNLAEYKELEARVDALRSAHVNFLK